MTDEQAQQLLVDILEQADEPLEEEEMLAIFAKIQQMMTDRALLQLFEQKRVRVRISKENGELKFWSRP